MVDAKIGSQLSIDARRVGQFEKGRRRRRHQNAVDSEDVEENAAGWRRHNIIWRELSTATRQLLETTHHNTLGEVGWESTLTRERDDGRSLNVVVVVVVVAGRATIDPQV